MPARAPIAMIAPPLSDPTAGTVALPELDPTRTATMPDDTPVLDTLADITATAIEHNTLDGRELMLARLAALVAVDAPPASYLLNAGTAVDVGVSVDDVQGVLIAVAPIVGTARVMSAAGNITRALGFAIAVAEAELD
jgi:hypothetical protein